MLGEDLDAVSAGYRVGYDSASHFSREYKRLFGEPPMRDEERLRDAAGASCRVRQLGGKPPSREGMWLVDVPPIRDREGM